MDEGEAAALADFGRALVAVAGGGDDDVVVVGAAVPLELLDIRSGADTIRLAQCLSRTNQQL